MTYVSGLYPWPFDGNLTTDNTALLIINMQVDYCGRGGWIDQLKLGVENMQRPIEPIGPVLKGMRKKGHPILFAREGHRSDLSDLHPNKVSRTRQLGLGVGDVGRNGRIFVRGEPGCEIVPELTPLTGEPVVDSPGVSAFHGSDIDQLLRKHGIRNIVITGVTTDGSVQSTMRDANDRGYECLILEDCCSSINPDHHDATLRMFKILRGHYGSITTSDSLLSTIA